MRRRGCADTGDDHCRLLSKTVSIGRKVPFPPQWVGTGWVGFSGEGMVKRVGVVKISLLGKSY